MPDDATEVYILWQAEPENAHPAAEPELMADFHLKIVQNAMALVTVLRVTVQAYALPATGAGSPHVLLAMAAKLALIVPKVQNRPLPDAEMPL
jgi:hypothetical protein